MKRITGSQFLATADGIIHEAGRCPKFSSGGCSCCTRTFDDDIPCSCTETVDVPDAKPSSDSPPLT